MPVLDRPGGRSVAYDVSGAPDGLPVLFQHGTGDSRLCRHPDDSIAADLGIRLITADRPGVGGSTRQSGRTVTGWVSDIEAIADALDVTQFVVAGHSGGGPHALAVAAALPDRVAKVGLASPLAPYGPAGPRELIKDSDLRLLYRLSRAKWLAEGAGRLEARYYRGHIEAFVKRCVKNWPADRNVFTDPVLAPMFRSQFREALAQGGIGALDDLWAFLDWGFRPEDVSQQVVLFAGDTDDILELESSRRLAARLPHCELTWWPGTGHYGVYGKWREFLQALT